jgi:hypothetical protein
MATGAIPPVLSSVALGGPGFVAGGYLETQPGVFRAEFASGSLSGSWTTAPDRPEYEDSKVNAIAAVDSRLVAVGFEPHAAGAAVWTSSDGLSWDRVPDDAVFAAAGMTAVVAGGPGFVAVGWAGQPGDRAAVWTSVDGRKWTRVADAPDLAGAQMQSIVRLGTGFVAVGWGSDGAAAWTSVDGTTWRRAVTVDSFRNMRMNGVVSGGKVLLAVSAPLPLGNSAGIWTSPSGP